MAILTIITILFILYTALIVYYYVSWLQVPLFEMQNRVPQVSISVLIPARNEADNIGRLLSALQQQTYPSDLIEIIVIDDHSGDDTKRVAGSFPRVRILSLDDDSTGSHKKRALALGIAASASELIVTTDADCLPAPEWLWAIAACYEQTLPAMIAAPVVFEEERSVLGIFQSLDFLMLQGITAASVQKKIHSMCNGANLAYQKSAFDAVEGFRGIDHIASGDDMLLMQKIQQHFPGNVVYLKTKSAIVHTSPMHSWKTFFAQRIRWASKAPAYKEMPVKLALLLVYAFNLSFLVLIIAGCWHPYLWLAAFVFLCLKTLVELPFIISVTRFYNQQNLVKYFFFFQPLHILYTIIAGWLGQMGDYEWKGRRVK